GRRADGYFPDCGVFGLWFAFWLRRGCLEVRLDPRRIHGALRQRELPSRLDLEIYRRTETLDGLRAGQQGAVDEERWRAVGPNFGRELAIGVDLALGLLALQEPLQHPRVEAGLSCHHHQVVRIELP